MDSFKLSRRIFCLCLALQGTASFAQGELSPPAPPPPPPMPVGPPQLTAAPIPVSVGPSSTTNLDPVRQDMRNQLARTDGDECEYSIQEKGTPVNGASFEQLCLDARRQWHQKNSDAFVVCTDINSGRFEPATATQHWIRNDQPIVVRAIHAQKANLVAVHLCGRISEGTVAVRPTSTHQVKSRGAAQAKPPREYTDHVFAPRAVGPVTIRIKSASTDQFKMVSYADIPKRYQAIPSYRGAVRVGLSVIQGAAVDTSIQVVQVDGSPQGEIQAKRSPMDVEVVLGLAPFLRSRSDQDCPGRLARCLNPYFGLGLVNLEEADRRQWFRSLYTGIEYEWSPLFSTALSVAFRRVDDLKPGVVIGGPAHQATAPVEQVWKAGLSLQLNFSMDFLRSATQTARQLQTLGAP